MRLASFQRSFCLLALAGASISVSTYVCAATYTWNKATGTQTFNNQANWGSGTAGFPNAIDDVADMSTLNITATQTINLSQSITLGQLLVGDTVGTSSGSFGRTFANSGGTGALVFQTTTGNAKLRWGFSDINNFLRANTIINVPVTLNSNTEIIADLQSSSSRNLYFQNGSLKGSGNFIVNAATSGVVAIFPNLFDLSNYTGTFKYTSNGAAGNMLQIAGTAPGVRNARQATLEMSVATAGGSVWIIDDGGNGGSLELGALRGDGLLRPFENRNGILRTGYLPGTNTYSGVLTSAARFNDYAGGAAAAVMNYEKWGANSTQIFSGANDYTGTTTVNEGTLLVNGTHTGGNNYVINGGGTLGGNGTINLALTKQLQLSGGTLAPGTSIGTLNIGGSVVMTSGSFDWEFSGGPPPGSNPGLGADVLNINGALTIASAVTLNGINLGAGILTGTKLVAISYATAGFPGTFGNAPIDDSLVTIGGKQFVINYDDTSFAGAANAGQALYSNAVTLTAVPETSSIFVFGLGSLFAIVAACRSKRFGVAATVQLLDETNMEFARPVSAGGPVRF